MSKPLIAQLYAARARQHWAQGNRQLAEDTWQLAKAEWYRWAHDRTGLTDSDRVMLVGVEGRRAM